MTMDWSHILDLTKTASGVVFAGASVAFTWTANRRAQYERVLVETAKVTTGDVAQARDRVGGILEPHRPAKPDAHLPPDLKLTRDVISDIFTVLWAFERLDGLYESLGGVLPPGKPNRPQRLLLIAVHGAVETWHEYAQGTYVDLKTDKAVSLIRSGAGVARLHKEMRRLRRYRTKQPSVVAEANS